MAEGENWDEWASIIRSCCLSSKTPLTMYEISRDVKLLEGRDIPYRAFDYRCLEEMLKNISNLKVFNLNGRIVAEAIPTQETAHICKMVRLQSPTNEYCAGCPTCLALQMQNLL